MYEIRRPLSPFTGDYNPLFCCRVLPYLGHMSYLELTGNECYTITVSVCIPLYFTNNAVDGQEVLNL